MLLLPGLCSTESQQLTQVPQNPPSASQGLLRILHCCKTAFNTPSDRFAQTRSQLRAKTVKNANVAELIEADCFGPGAGSRQSQVFICHKSLFLLQNLSAKKPQLWELMTRMLAKISRWQLMQRIMTSETF